MLKVYLDWNVITHLKDDSNKDLLTFLTNNRERVVFPYSIAHVKDLFASNPENNPDYKRDVELLTMLSANHLLEYSNDTNSPHPYNCTPENYIESRRYLLNIIAAKDKTCSLEDLFLKYNISLDFVLEELEKRQITPISLPQIGFYASNLADVFRFIRPYIDSYKSKDFAEQLKRKIRSSIAEDQRWKVTSSEFINVIDLMNEFCYMQTGKTFQKLIADHLPCSQKEVNSLDFFVSEYLSLNFWGFNSDKNRSLANIIADAEHAYYAQFCDLFVTNDGKLLNKSKALYTQSSVAQKAVRPQDLATVLTESLSKEYDIDYLIRVTVQEYGIPKRYNEQGKPIYRVMPYHFWGLFNYCEKLDLQLKNTDAILLRCYLGSSNFIFYTELDHFFNFIKSLIIRNEDKKKFDEEYVSKFLTRNYDIIKTAQYSFETTSMQIHLLSDRESPVPLPMVILSVPR